MTTPETAPHNDAPLAEEGADPGSEDAVPGLTPPITRRRSHKPLVEIMVDLELISARRAELAAHEAETTGRTTEEVLLESRALSGEAYARAVAERAGLDHVDLSLFRADLAAVNLIPVATAPALGRARRLRRVGSLARRHGEPAEPARARRPAS